MKNKLNLITICISFLFFSTIVYSDNLFNFEGKEIDILDEGNKIVATSDVKVVTNDNIIFTADKAIYNKLTSILTTVGKVKVVTNDNIIITSDKAIYNKLTLTLTAIGNVKIDDSLNKAIIYAEHIDYFKNDEHIITKGDTSAEFEKEYFIQSKNVKYDKRLNILSSNFKVNVDDNLGNLMNADNFKYLILEKLLKANKINYYDINLDRHFVEKGYLNLNTKELIGKDVKTNFNNSSFGNTQNEPRLRGNKIYSNKQSTIITKGVFTTCKKRDGCPPWVITAKETEHDKINKRIIYKNAWLKVYNVPVLYFPAFFHPDPSVKRQSGFLAPEIKDSSLFGGSAFIPYFHVISKNKDLTFQPRIYEGKKITLQNEYREVNKNSNHIVDFSYTRSDLSEYNDTKKTKSHLFSKSLYTLGISGFDVSELKFGVQKTSDETYLKTYSIRSPLLDYQSTLKNNFEFIAFKDDLSIQGEMIVYEDTTIDRRNDKYEYVYPSFSVNKALNFPLLSNSDLSLGVSGSQRKYNTNNYQANITNTAGISKVDYTKFGFVNEYNSAFENSNYHQKNPSTNTDYKKQEFMTGFLWNSSFPLLKKTSKNIQHFTPIASLRYSPNNTRDHSNSNNIITIDNVYAFGRAGQGSGVEGDPALTLGSKYKFNNKTRDVFKFDIATNLRSSPNEDLPDNSTLGQTMSDFFGKIELLPSNYFDFDYKFSLDNNLDRLNYNAFETTMRVNNFVTSFTYLEENYNSEGVSYIANDTQYTFDESNRLKFTTRKNKLTNLTEFYNLIYEYKNDCLTASLVYNKDYYNNDDLKPNESLLFNITIIPFETFTTENLKR